jgi:hypothetical protein
LVSSLHAISTAMLLVLKVMVAWKRIWLIHIPVVLMNLFNRIKEYLEKPLLLLYFRYLAQAERTFCISAFSVSRHSNHNQFLRLRLQQLRLKIRQQRPTFSSV